MQPAGAIESCATEHLVLPLTRTPPFSSRRRNGVYRLRNLRDASVSLRFSRLLSRRAEKRIGARITIEKSHKTYSQWNTKETSRVRVLFSKIYFYSSAESLPISTQNDQRCSSAFMTSRKGLSSGPIKWPVTAPFLPLHPITSVHRGMFFQPWECKLDKRLRTENSVEGVTNAGSSSANVLACKSNLSRTLP